MSVVKNKRTQSKWEFYNTAIKLRNDIIVLLLRDFGIKTRQRDIDFYKHHMNEEDAKEFEELLDKYEIQKIPEEYPSWLINKFRDSIFDILRSLHLCITRAYTIYPTIEREWEEKRIWQDRAIGCCENLLQEFTVVIDILPVDANKYIRYVEQIEKEILLLKAWRKSSNKLKGNF